VQQTGGKQKISSPFLEVRVGLGKYRVRNVKKRSREKKTTREKKEEWRGNGNPLRKV